MNIEIHFKDITPSDLKRLASVLGEGAPTTTEPIRMATTWKHTGKTVAKPVYGIDAGGNWRAWESVSLCAKELGLPSTTLRSRIDMPTEVSGYLLTFDRPAEVVVDEGEKDPTPEEVKIKERELRDELADAGPSEKALANARAVLGCHNSGEKKRWSSISECARDLGVSYDAVARGAKTYKKVKGWMLFYE